MTFTSDITIFRDGPVTVATVTFEGESYAGVSRHDPADPYNEYVGQNLALARLLSSVAAGLEEKAQRSLANDAEREHQKAIDAFMNTFNGPHSLAAVAHNRNASANAASPKQRKRRVKLAHKLRLDDPTLSRERQEEHLTHYRSVVAADPKRYGKPVRAGDLPPVQIEIVEVR